MAAKTECKKIEKVQAYWFSKGDALRYGDTQIPAVGVTHTHTGRVKLCESGFHASLDPLAALEHAPGPVLWLVELGGEIVHGTDKLAASERTYIARIDMEPLLREYARWCALEVIHLWDAPDVVKRYLETGDESLRAAAWDAAWAAARAAAWAAARDAARDAARAAQRAKFKGMVQAAMDAASRSDSSPVSKYPRPLTAPPKPGAKIEAVQGDIVLQQVDVIVNAANAALAGGGGVDGAIHRAAGADALRAACAQLGGCDPGDAKLTAGFGLSAKHIVHAVGPIWRGGNDGEADQLASCYRKALEWCDRVDAHSVAFPAISTGVYGFPADLAAAIAVKTLRETPTRVRRVVLVAFDDVTLDLYRQQLEAPCNA